jgi:arylsulfatase A-like enzyme
MYDDSTSLRQGSETEGIEFTNAFAPTPFCCPARATILTGRYTHNHGLLHNQWQASNGRLVYGGERMFLERGLENYTVAAHQKNQASYTTVLWANTSTDMATTTADLTATTPTLPR